MVSERTERRHRRGMAPAAIQASRAIQSNVRLANSHMGSGIRANPDLSARIRPPNVPLPSSQSQAEPDDYSDTDIEMGDHHAPLDINIPSQHAPMAVPAVRHVAEDDAPAEADSNLADLPEAIADRAAEITRTASESIRQTVWAGRTRRALVEDVDDNGKDGSSSSSDSDDTDNEMEHNLDEADQAWIVNNIPGGLRDRLQESFWHSRGLKGTQLAY